MDKIKFEKWLEKQIDNCYETIGNSEFKQAWLGVALTYNDILLRVQSGEFDDKKVSK